MEMIESLPDEEGGDEIDKVITLLYGPDSRIYRLFKDAMKLPYDKFCHWLATFFFICRMNRGLSDLCQDEDVNTDRYMHVSIFNKILRKMDSYGKDNHFGNSGFGRSWRTHTTAPCKLICQSLSTSALCT